MLLLVRHWQTWPDSLPPIKSEVAQSLPEKVGNLPMSPYSIGGYGATKGDFTGSL